MVLAAKSLLGLQELLALKHALSHSHTATLVMQQQIGPECSPMAPSSVLQTDVESGCREGSQDGFPAPSRLGVRKQELECGACSRAGAPTALGVQCTLPEMQCLVLYCSD